MAVDRTDGDVDPRAQTDGGVDPRARTDGGVDPRARTDGGVDPRAYLFALAPAGVVLAVAPALAAVPGAGLGVDTGLFRVAGPPLVLGGLGLAVWSVHSFAQAGEPPSPADEPHLLVTRGALAHSRNPLYLGTVLAAVGAGLALDAVLVVGYAALLWLVYHLLVVYREEPELRAAFGEEYERYRAEVPRWLPRR
jgi:protein-S-isoprenylcysteine O-methyltransferase Ste14